MKIYNYEGKNLEELTLQALKELNVKEDEMIVESSEETTGLLRKKKYNLKVLLKTDVLEFSKEYLNKLINGMGLDVQIETQRNENYLKLILHSENSPLLIGKNGRTLSSIQNILRGAITKETNMYVNKTSKRSKKNKGTNYYGFYEFI